MSPFPFCWLFTTSPIFYHIINRNCTKWNERHKLATNDAHFAILRRFVKLFFGKKV